MLPHHQYHINYDSDSLEESAGQTVFHFHMHMIPRYKNDNVGLGWHMGELSEADKNEILEKLK